MKKAIFLLALAFCPVLQAQLSVANGGYVYANDQFVFVKQNVNLQNGGNFYLRNGSQLLQGGTVAANSGEGKLSVFQEGTVDNFEYNYWCSPVGNASAASGNENFGITMLHQPTGLITSNPATILPMGNYNGQANPLAIAPYWIHKYISQNGYSGWVAVNAANGLGAGEGFSMKGTAGTDATTVQGVQNNPGSNQRYDFRGKPNDGDILINVEDGKWTLTGNPYPSAIDLSAFLTEQLNCTGTAYFWEQDKNVNTHILASYSGGYGAFTPVSRGGTGIYVPAIFYNYDNNGILVPGSTGAGNMYSRYFSPIGQGFMIVGTANGTVSMKNAYRVFQKEAAGLSVFERPDNLGQLSAAQNGYLPEIPNVAGFDYTTVSTAPVPQIRFSAKVGNGIRSLVLGFDPAATDGPDHAMDAASADSNPIDLYFAMDNKAYIISVIDFDINKTVPLGFKNNVQTNFQLTMNEMLNFSGAEHVYVHDKLNGTYHEITNSVYEVTLPPGTNTDRFELTFTENALGTPSLSAGSFAILQDNPKQQLLISNPGNLEIKSVYLYDLNGKLVMNKEKLGSLGQYQFSTESLAESVYIVKVVTGDEKDIAQKISVFRTNN